MTSPLAPRPRVNGPATIHLSSDSLAAKVVRINRKSVTVTRVKVGDPIRINSESEPFPVIAREGDIESPIDATVTERFALQPNGSYRNGQTSVTFGRSVSIRDYRD